jgi:hypothetical protein
MSTAVTREERDLLVVARALVERGPYAAIEPILRADVRLDGLTVDAMRLLRDTLAKGSVLALARGGGWRKIARRAGAGVEVGRLWEVAEPQLRFSHFAFALCRWLTCVPLLQARPPLLAAVPRTGGDELVAMFACALVEDELLERVVAWNLAPSALAWLACPRMLAEAEDAPPPAVAFERLVAEPVVLEGLSDELARRAVAFERALSRTSDPAEVVRLGRAREAALGALVDAAARADRWDLVSFVVEAGREIVGWNVEHRLDPSTPLGDRAEARHAAGAQLRVLGRIGRRHEELRLVRHFDEDYGLAQHLLARWEPLGNDGFRRAAELLERQATLPGD